MYMYINDNHNHNNNDNDNVYTHTHPISISAHRARWPEQLFPLPRLTRPTRLPPPRGLYTLEPNKRGR